MKKSVLKRPNPEDFIPAYFCDYYGISNGPNRRYVKEISIHLTALILAVCILMGVYYYHQNRVILSVKKNSRMDDSVHEQDATKENDNEFIRSIDLHSADLPSISSSLIPLINEIKQLKAQIVAISDWRKTFDNDEIARYIEDISVRVYDSDRIGLKDYAAAYAGGSILGVSENTDPFSDETVVLGIYKMNVFSRPEQLIQPSVLPGSCFAFRGSTGSIRIKLSKPIKIGSVTLSHASKFLLDIEEMSSAPRDFQIFGYSDTNDKPTFLGQYTYDLSGKQHQTFKVNSDVSQGQLFHSVKLSISSNYGKAEFTCVYRFRVHKADEQLSTIS